MIEKNPGHKFIMGYYMSDRKCDKLHGQPFVCQTFVYQLYVHILLLFMYMDQYSLVLSNINMSHLLQGGI